MTACKMSATGNSTSVPQCEMKKRLLSVQGQSRFRTVCDETP